jgi:ribosomal protein S18 acetylase RimI-like enzyme
LGDPPFTASVQAVEVGIRGAGERGPRLSRVPAIDYEALRADIVSGTALIAVLPLERNDVEDIAWSGSRAHLDNVVVQLERVGSGQVFYLVVRANGHAVAKGGIDFAKEAGAGTVWQLATHPRLEGVGLATRLIAELEQCAGERRVRRLRLGVELDNPRARRLYEHLGYRQIGESDASWDAEDADGSHFLYETTLAEMEKLV